MLLHASVNVHVLVIVYPQPLATCTSTPVAVMLPLQLSVAVNVPGAGTSVRHWKFWVAGATATGAVLSITVTIWVAVAVFPQLSVAVHVLVMVPQPCTTLFVSVKLTVIVGSQLSVAVTEGPAIIVLVHCTVSLAGTPIKTGRVVSTTVNVCVAVDVLPQRSVDVQVLVIVPHPSTTFTTSP